MQYTQEQLENAFQKVQNKEHWKNPIKSTCHFTERAIVAQAIIHFTGTEATFAPINEDYLQVTAPGYYLGPCN